LSIPRKEANRLLNRNVMLVLRAGMYISIALLSVGVILYLANDGEVGSVLGPVEAIESALNMEAEGWMSLGIISLIMTPLAGVVIALAVFVRAKELRMVGVSLLVICVVALAILVKLIA
jgi:uncharacterized membrane protein